MDNIYNLVKFSKACFLHYLKVLVHGLIRKVGRGVPPVVK